MCVIDRLKQLLIFFDRRQSERRAEQVPVIFRRQGNGDNPIALQSQRIGRKRAPPNQSGKRM